MLYIVVIQARFSLGIVARMYNTLQTHVFVAFYDLLSEWLEGHSKWGVDKVSFMYYICNVNLFLISPIWKTLNEKDSNNFALNGLFCIFTFFVEICDRKVPDILLIWLL